MRYKRVSAATLAVTVILLLGSAWAAPPLKLQDNRQEDRQTTAFPPIGKEVRTLPKGSRLVQANRQSYRYENGSFYQSGRNGVYLVVRAPIGARVRTLPADHVSFHIGTRDYFFANLAYYLWDKDRKEYVVVEKPEGAEKAMGTRERSASSEVFVYPGKGQSEEQRAQDRYECYRWAVEESGFDPAAGERELGNADDYKRANEACLTGRGYTVN